MLAAQLNDLALNVELPIAKLAAVAGDASGISDFQVALVVCASALLILLLIVAFFALGPTSSTSRPTRQVTRQVVTVIPRCTPPHGSGSTTVVAAHRPTAATVPAPPVQPQVALIQTPRPRTIVHGRAHDPNLLCRFCGLELEKYDHRPCRKGEFDE